MRGRAAASLPESSQSLWGIVSALWRAQGRAAGNVGILRATDDSPSWREVRISPANRVAVLANSSVTHCMLLRMLFQSCSWCWGSCSHAAVILEELGLCRHLLLFTESALQAKVLEIFLDPCPMSAGAVFKHEFPSSTDGHCSLCTLPNLFASIQPLSNFAS